MVEAALFPAPSPSLPRARSAGSPLCHLLVLDHLLAAGARVMVSVRRVKVAMDSAHHSAAAFARVHTPDYQGNDLHTPFENPFTADPPRTTPPQDQGKLAQSAVLTPLAPQNTAAEPLAHIPYWSLGRNSSPTLPPKAFSGDCMRNPG